MSAERSEAGMVTLIHPKNMDSLSHRLHRAVMFSCGIAAYSSTRSWRSSLMFLRFRLWTHLTKLSQKCWIGEMSELSADQLRTSMSHTVTVRIILVTAAVMLSIAETWQSLHEEGNHACP